MSKEMDDHIQQHHSEPVPVSTIEQELEAGLIDNWYVSTGTHTKQPCTRIFLPAAKYEEFDKYFGGGGIVPTHRFHGIPVYSWPEEKIHYCTD